MNAYTATHTYNAPLRDLDDDDERIADPAEEDGYASGYDGDDE